MTQREYLSELESMLEGRLDQNIVAGHLQFYRDYINEQIAGGKTEAEVIASLQEPALTAKTILSSEEAGQKREEDSVFGRVKEAAENRSGFFSISTLKNGSVPERAGLIIVLAVILLILLSVVSSLGRILFWPVAVVAVGCTIREFIQSRKGK